MPTSIQSGDVGALRPKQTKAGDVDATKTAGNSDSSRLESQIGRRIDHMGLLVLLAGTARPSALESCGWPGGTCRQSTTNASSHSARLCTGTQECGPPNLKANLQANLQGALNGCHRRWSSITESVAEVHAELLTD
ncbi:uncharacterized protein PITG_18522 [Phytophthora infestans T30-4]|uniref:Uncharacterized protein n=1 Tax=Phytophthora infestans (strain T30-4) TaxID=403677 RepID=D0NY89_PHYIT|nr:uncharacterized protein PITG_18522 [Phytophthora infestans T30-4]EEY68078.1 hypothetical protein PITG_18522 [Phytophthora infestans T30-4]|eukprot:XP_002997636.1 hypothetical protein PITG_18522 [Phytophthora infestans T30-4]